MVGPVELEDPWAHRVDRVEVVVRVRAEPLVEEAVLEVEERPAGEAGEVVLLGLWGRPVEVEVEVVLQEL